MSLLSSRRKKEDKEKIHHDLGSVPLLAVPMPDPTRLSEADPTHWDQLWNSFDRYYSENEKEIMEAAKLDVLEIASSKRSIQKDALVTSFLEHSKTILNGLQFLSEIHPAISVVVGAFGALIKIELIRRDNNLKAISVKIQMQNLMCALFQLRRLRTEMHDYVLGQRIARMMSLIAEEIKACGSDLSYYQDKKLVSRLLHSKFFEERLAFHISTFAERRSELNLLFTSYVAGRTQETNEIAMRIEYKVDNLVNVLKHFDSPREKEATKFIEGNGGIERCISDKTLLIDLMGKTGDAISEGSDAGQAQKLDVSVASLMKQLQRELGEDIAEALKKNMANFEGMLRIQNNNLQHMSHLVENQTSEIMKIHSYIAMIVPGPRKHVLLADPDLRKIWGEMGLRQSVKAKKFVLTLKDYLTKMSKTPRIAASPRLPILEVQPAPNLVEPVFPEERCVFTTGGPEAGREDDEDWVLHYIDVVHLDPIVEAIDDDSSGFISIHEANRFAIARPKGWSLLRWFAYWAAGWALSTMKYKEKILDLVQQIYLARLNALPCNLAYVTDYLDDPAFQSLDILLRSTQPRIGEHDATDRKLAKVVSDFDNHLERRLLENLKDLKYDLLSEDNVTLVTGPGRIERFTLPLIFLLLQHHLKLMQLAGHRRFCSFEMSAVSRSLQMVFKSLKTRAVNLEAVFQKKSRQAPDLFKTFSFGMFELFTSSAEYRNLDNSLLIDEQPYASKPSAESLPMEADREALKMLSEGLDHKEDQPAVLEQNLVHNFSPPSPGTEGVKVSILADGWTARMYRDRGLPVMQKDLFVIKFDDPGPMGTVLNGWGEGWLGPGTITGRIERQTHPMSGNAREGGAQKQGGARISQAPQDVVGAVSPSTVTDVEMYGKLDEDADESERIHNTESIRSTLEGDDSIALLDFVMHRRGLIYHYRVTPVEGTNGTHWKGEWWRDNDKSDKDVRPFDMFKAPPDAVRGRYILEDATLAKDGELPKDPDGEYQPSSVEQLAKPGRPTPVAPESSPPTSPDEGVPGPSSDSSSRREDDTCGIPESPPSNTDPVDRRGDEAMERSEIARARWRYVGEAVLYQVRRRLHSTSFYREAARERKRYILITMKLDHEEQTEAEHCEVLNIRARVDPNVCYVWEQTAAFYSTRKVGRHATSYVRCDLCGDGFGFTRHMCITCQLPSLNDQVDICTLCLNKTETITTPEYGFTHKSSHTLLKSNKRILGMERACLLNDAKARSKRVKQLFRDKEKTHGHDKVAEGSQTKSFMPQCTHCLGDITLPCWIHAISAQNPDVYVCMECESTITRDNQLILLRIFNSDDTEAKVVVSDVERHYNRAKTVLAEELGALEVKFNQRMEKTLNAHVEKIQRVVDVGSSEIKASVVSALTSVGGESSGGNEG